jgi:hypothetical protein
MGIIHQNGYYNTIQTKFNRALMNCKERNSFGLSLHTLDLWPIPIQNELEGMSRTGQGCPNSKY